MYRRLSTEIKIKEKKRMVLLLTALSALLRQATKI